MNDRTLVPLLSLPAVLFFGLTAFLLVVTGALQICAGIGAAAVIERAILGGAPVFAVPSYALIRWRELVAYAVLGVVSGVAATLFVNGLLTVRKGIRAWRGVPGWVKPALCG